MIILSRLNIKFMRYLVINKGTDNLHLVVNNYVDGRCIGTAINIPGCGMCDILPYATTIENCKLISCLHDWELRGMVRIFIEE